jgi:hypothetical protein
MNEGAWTAIIVAVVTAAGGLWTALTTKRKIDADSESITVATMRGVLEEVRTELDRCHMERASVLERLQGAESRIGGLEQWIKLNYGIDPEDINGHPV